MPVTSVKLVPMDQNNLEYIVSSDAPQISQRQFEIISPEEAYELYFTKKKGKPNVYVIIGGQKGDEGKGMTAELIKLCDPNIGWALAPNSTHNAGKGIHTTNEKGEDVKVTLHLCPGTLVDSQIHNYIGSNTQVNPFALQTEINEMRTKTGRDKLGVNYHLMVDSYANLVLPTDRALDVVCKPNTMGSTLVGATSSASNATGKVAPILEHVLYDNKEFLRLVNDQIQQFNDKIKHDTEFDDLGIVSMFTLGAALSDISSLEEKSSYSANGRLKTLAEKLSKEEKQFFVEKNPAQFLLDQYKSICNKDTGLFEIGDCKKEITNYVDNGISGIIEGVQSVLLSGPVKYSQKNRTAAGTHSAGTIGDAGLDPAKINYITELVFKLGNTSVGGNERTISGFIEQDALYKLKAKKDGKVYTFEKAKTLEEFISKDQIVQAFHEVNEAFYESIDKGDSIRNSIVRIEGIDMDLSLAEAHALLTAYVWGEKGETSEKARIVRFDDMVESGVVYDSEGHPFQVRNAEDRAMYLPWVGVVIAYKVVKEYGGYNVGDIILPGMPLRQEHLTIASCIPIIYRMPAWTSITADGKNNLTPGQRLDPNLCNYLSLVSQGSPIMAISAGATLDKKILIKEV